MELGLRGKVAMVAAGTKGIGLATAVALAKEGALVSICGRDVAKFKPALDQIGDSGRAFRADVGRPDELMMWHEGTIDSLGHPDILVTNTGGPPAGSWTEMTDTQWQEGFESTLLNVVRMVRIVHPEMRKNGWGRIVHVTSLVAKEPNNLLPISSTLRSGLIALTRLQATELAPHGITVNGVLPGHTLTDRQHHLAEVRAQKLGGTPEEMLKKQASEVPMKRLAQPEEIAAAITFLCGQTAGYITGTSLLVDGGLTKGMG